MKKHLSLLITTAAALLALAYVLFVFMPGQAKIKELRLTLQQRQKYVAEASKLPATIAQLEAEFEECRRFTDSWRQRSPSGSKMADLIGRITAEATASQIKLAAFHPATSLHHAMLSEMPANLTVEGSFMGITEFVRRLDGIEASIWITDVNLAPEGEDAQSVHCELTLSIFSEIADIAD